VAKLALIILALMLITNVGYNSFKRQYVKDQIPIQLSSGRTIFSHYNPSKGCIMAIYELDDVTLLNIQKNGIEFLNTTIDEPANQRWYKTPIPQSELSEGYIRGDFCFSSSFKEKIYAAAFSNGSYYIENLGKGGITTLLVFPAIKWVVYYRVN
jgi:hypothetical protein